MSDLNKHQMPKIELKDLGLEWVTLRAEEDGTYTLGWFEAQILLDDEWHVVGEQRKTKEDAVLDVVNHMALQSSPHVYRVERQTVTVRSDSLAAAWLSTPGCVCRPIVLGNRGDEYIYMAEWFNCPVHGIKRENDHDTRTPHNVIKPDLSDRR